MTSMYEVDGEEMKQRLQNDYYQQQAQAQQNGQQPLDGAGAGQQPVNYAALTTPELATMLQQEVSQQMGMPYGGYPMMPQQLYGMPSMASGGVMPGGAGMDDEPLYVNAKQYNRILKRRQARARLEAQMKHSREKAPYMHESRHRHAMNRPRGPGGRFLTAAEIAEMKAQEAKQGKAETPSAPPSAGAPSKRARKDSGNAAADDDASTSSSTEPNGRPKAKAL